MFLMSMPLTLSIVYNISLHAERRPNKGLPCSGAKYRPLGALMF